jgi:hypothetical protein
VVAGVAIHPPVHLTIHPDEPIRSVDDAVKVVERHGDMRDPAAKALLLELSRAQTQSEVETAAHVFREWARSEGLLLVPPEDRPG